MGRYSRSIEIAKISVVFSPPNPPIREQVTISVEKKMAKKVAKKAAKKQAAKKADTAKKTKKKAVTGDEATDGKPLKKNKTKTKRKSRAKKDVVVRQKISWCVYNHAMKPVAKYAYNQKKAAEKKARELSPEGKLPHFVAKIKEEVVGD